MFKKNKKIIFFSNKKSLFTLFFLGIVICSFLNGTNILNYPYYESDEGTYASQAWAVMNEGKLAPYTYWYDHPPLGWITLAAWYSLLPEGIFTFGTSIDSGRIFMLLIHLISASLVFFITFKITKSSLAALLSTLIFSISPLEIYFHRRVLLDNILVLWVLLSIAVLYKSNLTLREYFLSGLFYAFAFMTKITTAMFGPAILLLVFFMKDKTHKTFRTALWLLTSILTTSIYILFAMIKNELFPSLFSSNEKVSLFGSILFQVGRGNSLYFFQKQSDFLVTLNDWFNRDSILTIGILSTILIGVVLSTFIKDINLRFFTLTSLSYLIFLIRGGIVINLYIIPIIPIVSILFSIILIIISKIIFNLINKILYRNRKINSLGQKRFISVVIFSFIFLTILNYCFLTEKNYLYKNEVDNQRKAIEWIKNTLPTQSNILIDSVMLVELRDPNYINNKIFNNADWFYKVSRDPQIKDDKYKNNWKNLDYIAITHEMLKQIDKFEEEDIVFKSYKNSLPIAKWFEGSSSFIDEQKLITTNGDWSMIYAVNSDTKTQLLDSWNFYKENFIFDYGQTIDPTNNITTSEGQSYAMLRSAWMNDKEIFNGAWLWTQHHMQHRLDDKLISWKWSDNQLLDSANAIDADLDIALALMFGNKIFKEDSYLEDAKEIINDIWTESVVDINGTLYIVSSNKSQAQVHGGLLFNPSYMSPAHYRIFAEVDPDHDWLKLADDTYKILDNISRENISNLPSNWYVVNTKNGLLSSANQNVNEGADDYGYDSFRIIWRVWLDFNWFNSKDSKEYLTEINEYVSSETNGENVLPTIFDPVDGDAISWENSNAVQSGYVLALALNDKQKALTYYENNIANTYKEEGYWGSRDGYYDQNWVWFMSAVFNNDVYNLWEAF